MALFLEDARRRLYFWRLILDSLVGASDRDQLYLKASAICDVLLCLGGTPLHMPIARYACTVKAPQLDLVFHVRANSDDLYLALPYREGDVHRAILDPLRPGDVFVDVGANIGYYSMLASRAVGSGGRVMAIEPVPSTLAGLRANLRTNRCENVESLGCAVWSSPGTLMFQVVEGAYGEAHVVSAGGATPVIGPVPARTLDEICLSIPRIRVMKLDIEEAEYEALAGAHGALDKTDRIVIECYQADSEVSSLLKSHGFALSRLSFGAHLLATRL